MSACQERMGTRIKLEEKIVIFMAEYAAYLINRLEVGKDGKTAYERCRGKRATVLAIEFGEKLLWKVRQKNRLEKLNPRWKYGVFVVVKATSGEVWAVTKGLQTVRSVRRIPLEERWNETNKDFVKHVPWNESGEDPEADGDLPEALEGATATGAVAAGSMDPPQRLSSTRRRLHDENSTSRRRMLKHTATPRAVQVAEPCFKAARGRHTRLSAERGSEI